MDMGDRHRGYWSGRVLEIEDAMTMANEEEVIVGGPLDRAAAVLGVSRKQVVAATLAVLAVVAVSVYLAVNSGLSLYRQYESGGAVPTPAAGDDGRSLLERAELPTFLEAGEVLPDAPMVSDGTQIRCGPELVGRAGLRSGWVWDSSEFGCRRVRQQR